MLPLATAVTLAYTSPLFLTIYLVVLGKTRLRNGMLGALAIGFIGVALLLRPTLRADQILGGLIGLGGGMMAGLAYYNVKELGERGEAEERTVFYFALLSTVVSGVWMTLFEFHPVDLNGGLLLLGVAGFGTLAQLAMTRAYKRGRTLMAASLAYSTVIFASLFGVLVWQETLSPAAWLAIGLIIASGVAATWFSRANPAEQD
jgi:S-adenosylmethionine uptake transporter